MRYPGFTSISERIYIDKYIKKKLNNDINNINKEQINILDFGPCMGASTIAMANSIKNKNVKIYAFDAFQFKKNTDFKDYFFEIIQNYDESLLKYVDENETNIFFKRLFEKLTKKYSSIYLRECTIKSSKKDIPDIPKGRILLAHIDLPKTMNVGIHIMDYICDNLQKNQSDLTLVFQDYAYHWSSEIIIYVGILINNGAKVKKIVGPSLYLNLKNPSSIIKNSNLDYENYCITQSKEFIIRMIDISLDKTESFVDQIRKNELLLACSIYCISQNLDIDIKEKFYKKIIKNKITINSLTDSLLDIQKNQNKMQLSI